MFPQYFQARYAVERYLFTLTETYYLERRHWKTMQELGIIPVRSLNVEAEVVDGQHFLLLIINEEVHS